MMLMRWRRKRVVGCEFAGWSVPPAVMANALGRPPELGASRKHSTKCAGAVQRGLREGWGAG